MLKTDQALAVRALRSAVPYIRMYKGKVFVVKAGGGVFGDEAATRSLMEQIGILHYFGVRVVLVHGGGPQLTEFADALGVPARIVQGRRITDAKSVELTAMVLNGLINTRILALCRELDIEAIGVSGVDAGLIRAHKRPPSRLEGSEETVDFGFVGDIDAIDTSVITKLLDGGLMPVVSPLSADRHGVLLNINADTVAAALGAALGAEKLIVCTGAPGILERVEDPGSLVSYTDLKGLERLRTEGCMQDGMLPKARAIEHAIRGGVRRVHVVSYKSPEGILGEVFTNEGTGTLIVADLNALTAAEQQVSGAAQANPAAFKGG
ncbi:MAG: acetylglutamate kinase [Steroidobacteraceae bacterium]